MLPREDLANSISTTRESLGRLLKDVKEEKHIHISKRAIEIVKLNELKKIANALKSG